MTGAKQPAKTSLSNMRWESIEALLRLLRRPPLPLRELVRIIDSDPTLMSTVMRAARAECASGPPDLESAIVLLGADRLRTLAQTAARAIPRRNKAVLPTRRRMRALRKAIDTGSYPVSTRAVAAAMLRDLERS